MDVPANTIRGRHTAAVVALAAAVLDVLSGVAADRLIAASIATFEAEAHSSMWYVTAHGVSLTVVGLGVAVVLAAAVALAMFTLKNPRTQNIVLWAVAGVGVALAVAMYADVSIGLTRVISAANGA